MRTIFYTIAAFMLTLCSACGQTFKITSTDADLVALERFVVLKGESMTPKDNQTVNEDDLYKRMKRAIVTELEERGYKHVDDSTHQFTIDYIVGSFDVMNSGTIGPLGETPAETPAEVDQARGWSRDTKESILEISVVEVASRKEVWKSSGTLALDASDVRLLDNAVYKALKKFPNRKKKKK